MQLENNFPSSFGYIYKLTNRINGKVYIGQTTQIENRFKKYKGGHCETQPKLYKALKKYGVDSFLFEIFDTADNSDTLNFLEETYIACFDSIEYGYNSRPGGNCSKMTKEHKQKISISNTGKKLSEETKQKISKSHIGMKVSEETRQKISKIQTGMKKNHALMKLSKKYLEHISDYT